MLNDERSGTDSSVFSIQHSALAHALRLTAWRYSMADKKTPSRWTSDPDTVEVSDRYSDRVGESNENSGGISNRPLEEEIEHQHSLPERGTRRSEESGEGDVE